VFSSSFLFLLCALFFVACQPGSENWVDWKMKRAQKFERQGRFLRAAEECQDVADRAEKTSRIASALFLRGDCLLRAGRYLAAEKTFRGILSRFSDPVYRRMGRYRLVEAYKVSGRLPEAAQTLRKLLETLDQQVERALALMELGKILLAQSESQAMEVLAEAQKLFVQVSQTEKVDPDFRKYARDLVEQIQELRDKGMESPRGSRPFSRIDRS